MVKISKKILPTLFILLLTATLLYEALADSPTYDEPANMAASFSYVYKNDYRLYPDNPPLVKILAGLSLLPIHNKIFFPEKLDSYQNPKKFNLYIFGTEFLYKSKNETRAIIFLLRLSNILFTIGIGLLLFCFAKNLYGEKAGLFTLTLYSLDPNVRGHGHILAFDLPLSFFILLILYLTYQFFLLYPSSMMQLPPPSRSPCCIASFRVREFAKCLTKGIPKNGGFYTLLISLSFALGMLTKFTMVFFGLPYLLGIFLLGGKRLKIPVKTKLTLFVSIIAVSFAFLWSFGLVSGYNRKTLDYDEIPLIDSAHKTLSSNFSWNFIKILPLPYYYKAGLQTMYAHNLVSQPAYLLGEVRAKNDWFFYFPASFMLKAPIPTLIFIFLTLFLLVRQILLGKKTSPKNFFPFLFGAAFFFFLMIFSHINNVFRYLFPAYILLMLGAGQFVNLVNFKKLPWRFITVFLVGYLILTSFFSFPYDLSYTNEFTGIPTKGFLYLSDSEIDWGQDLERLSLWLKNNQLDRQTIALSYLGTADPSFYGIKYRQLKFEDLESLSGVAAISVGNLTLGDWRERSSLDYKLGFIKKAPLDFLRKKKPFAMVGKSIFVYKF